jgi:hypothetical protein
MDKVYEKQTKDTVNFPEYNLCFLGILVEKLETYGLLGNVPKTGAEAPTVLNVPVISRNYPYCYDAIELIKKTLKRRGVDCEMSSYQVTTLENKGKEGGEQKGYSYMFKLKKASNKRDIPIY